MDEVYIENSGDAQSSQGEITYTVADYVADWTRGLSITEGSDITSFGVYSVYGSGTDDSCVYIDDETASVANGVWGFSPSLYYPSGKSLKFWAYSPLSSVSASSGVTYSFDLEKEVSADGVEEPQTYNEVLTIDYSVPTVDARDQPDIVVAAGYESDGSSGDPLELNFEHLLTKISLSAKLVDGIGETSEVDIYDDTGEYTGTQTVDNYDRYVVTRFTMQHIATKGTLIYADDAIISTNDSGYWIIDQSQRGVVITSTAYTLASPDSEHAVELNNTDYEYIMIDSEGKEQALFMIPQRIENLTEDVYAYKPTVYVTVYDKALDAYYRTSELYLPTPDGAWHSGQHINLQLEFDPNSEDLALMMSIQPTVREWTDHTVYSYVDPNITMWCSDNEISAAAGQVINLYTNSSSTPEVTFDDAGVTCVVGEKVGDYFPLTIDASASAASSVVMTVKVVNSDTNSLTKQFAITIN